MKLAITGTPGTGKTTLAKSIAESLGVLLIQANELAKEKSIVQADGSVDTQQLRDFLLEKIKEEKGFVVEGHLLCEFSLPVDYCLVLRCNPRELEGRLRTRGYEAKKLNDNLECEALDYCLVNVEGHYDCVVQLDNTRFLTAETALGQLDSGDEVRWSLDDLGGKKLKKRVG